VPDRPHVAVLTSVHPPFDTRVFYREARSMAAAGFRVTLLAPGAPRGEREGVRLEPLPSWGGRAGRPLRWPVLLWKAMRLHADLYHLHDPELLPWGVLLRRLTRRPVVYDSHEYLREDIEKKHWIPGPLRRPVARFAAAVERWAARRLDAVVAVTEEMAQRFAAVQPRTVVVRNLPEAPQREPVFEGRPPVVIHSGLMNAERGLGMLHATAAVVAARYPAARFHILGPVEWWGLPAAERNRTESEWEAVGVRFLGTVPYPEVPSYLEGAAVGWLPRDPAARNNLLAWPNKLVEYMAAGLPIVASDLPTQSRVIREVGCGLVVPAMDPEAHAEAICYLLEHPEEAAAMGRRGFEAARTRFSWEGEATKLQKLYTSLLGLGEPHD